MSTKTFFILASLLCSNNLLPAPTFQPDDFTKRLETATDFCTKTSLFLQLLADAQAQKCSNELDTLQFAIDHVTIQGAYLEMGVFNGRTINFLSRLRPHVTIHGFDSFEGLPEDWIRQDTTDYTKGKFALKTLPSVGPNIQLYKGWFDATLPIFKEKNLRQQPIAFMHIDCDLYSSTKTIFEVLGDNIVEGTILSFDELYNYPGFENHEMKAFLEFLNDKNLSAEFLAYNVNHEQVVVKIIKK